MITKEEYPFLPLYFDEDEEGLWSQLQKLSPRERVKTAKHALRLFFETEEAEQKASPYNGEENVNLTETEAEVQIGTEKMLYDPKLLVNRENQVNGLHSDRAEDKEPLLSTSERSDEGVETKLSLEDLFVQTQPEAPTPTNSSNPLKNLLSIIGEEEDEEVLEFFRSTGK